MVSRKNQHKSRYEMEIPVDVDKDTVPEKPVEDLAREASSALAAQTLLEQFIPVIEGLAMRLERCEIALRRLGCDV